MPPTKRALALTINGRQVEVLVEPRKLLVDVIREEAGLTGTHIGCEHGVCGACTILLDGETARSCLTFALQAAGGEIWTVEGVAGGETLSPLQTAFWQNHGLQCGYCTPGILMASLELLAHNPAPAEAEVREALSGNLCRCTGYQNIIKAVLAAAEAIRAGDHEPLLEKVRA